MKYLFIFILLLMPFKVKAISAESYIVMDADSGRVIEGKNISKEKLIASTTKIMTCIIALENSDLNKMVKVGDEVLKAYGSAIYINMGEEMSIKDLLYGLMLRSGNDAAIEIAYSVSGNMDNFVKKMNEKAYELKMTNTNFINNHGLENDEGYGNTSTAYDMALLMKYALHNETFKEIIGTEKYTTKTEGKSYVWKNKNKLLFSYDKLIGGKTGFTKKARRTLVTSAVDNGRTSIVVTLNDGNDFADHKELHEKVFSKYERVLLLDKNQKIENKYYLQEDFYALLTEDEQQKVKINYEINNPNSNEVGVASVYLNDELLGSLKIYKESVEEKNEENKKENFLVRFIRWLFKW